MSIAFTSVLSRALPARTAPRLRLCARRAPARWVAASAAESARAKIESENVMVFSTTYCPYCARVKALFEGLAVPHAVWELDQMREGGEIRRFLAEETGQTTVPSVFVGGVHVGGCSETVELHEQGKLLGMVNAARM